MATFDECIDLSLTNSGLCLPEGFKLKEKQVQTLKSVFAKTDCMSILPTGYGESIIFQLLPWFLQRKYHRTSPMIVIVVSPLSSLMQDQVMALRRQGIKAW
jgi:ATP-dependent DNA helicase RecQ